MVLPYVSTNPADETWGIFLKNEGIGPAVINYQGVILDGRISDMHNVVSKMREEGALGTCYEGGCRRSTERKLFGSGKEKHNISSRSKLAGRTGFRKVPRICPTTD